MLGIRSVFTFFVCSFLVATQTAMGFAVVPSVSRTMATQNTVSKKPTMVTRTARPAIVVDQAIVEMVERSDPIGALAMFVLVISLWELFTPGRQDIMAKANK